MKGENGEKPQYFHKLSKKNFKLQNLDSGFSVLKKHFVGKENLA